MRSKVETAPTVDENGTDGSGKTHIQDDFLPAVGNYDSTKYAANRFTDDPQGVSEAWPFEYQAMRKKVNGSWQLFSAATLHRKYGKDSYVASLDTEFAVLRVTGFCIPTKAQNIYVVPSLYKGDTQLTPVIRGVKRRNSSGNDVAMAWNGSTSQWTDTGLAISYNSSTNVITIAYGITASVPNGQDIFKFTIANVVDNTDVFSEEKTLTVNTAGNDTYNILPSLNQIIVSRSSDGYAPDTFTLTCGYSKVDVDNQVTKVADVTGLIDNTYNLYFRRHSRAGATWESTFFLYSALAKSLGNSSSGYDDGMLVDVPVADYDAIEFILCKNTSATVAAASVTGQIGSVSVPVLTDGSVGATGPSYYYLGEWADENDSEYIPDGTQIEVTEYERPFISYTQNGETLYFLYIGTGTGEAALVTTSTRDNPSLDSEHWAPMQSQNKYIISKAIFAKYANFGSSIFNGDWLLSSNGHIGNNSFESSDRIRVSTFGSDTTKVIVPHTLFDILNPTKDSEQMFAEDFDSSQALIDPTTPGHNCDLADGDGFLLEAGKTYYVRAYAHTSGSEQNVQHLPHYYLQLLDGNGGSLNIVDLFTQDGISQRNNIAFFRVAATGTYYFGVQATPKIEVGEADEYGRLWLETWSFGIARFVPHYAVDFLTGMTVQGHGFSSGAQRRAKTILDNATFDYYTKDYHGERMIDIEACGTFMEIRDSYYPLLQLPVFCHSGTRPEWSGNTITRYVPYTDEDRDYARSFVGTKLLIYITNGGIRCSYYHYGYHGGNTQDWATSAEDFCFVYKHSKETGESSATYKTRTLETVEGQVPGGYGPVLDGPQFFEIECCTGLDLDGEIVYWRINAIGKMA